MLLGSRRWNHELQNANGSRTLLFRHDEWKISVYATNKQAWVHRDRGSKLITRSEMCHARMYVRKNAKAARLLITRPTVQQEVVITRENLSIARIFIVPLAIQSRKQHDVVWYLNSFKWVKLINFTFYTFINFIIRVHS